LLLQKCVFVTSVCCAMSIFSVRYNKSIFEIKGTKIFKDALKKPGCLSIIKLFDFCSKYSILFIYLFCYQKVNNNHNKSTINMVIGINCILVVWRYQSDTKYFSVKAPSCRSILEQFLKN